MTGPRALPSVNVPRVAAMIGPLTWSQIQVTAVTVAESLPGKRGCLSATAIEGRPDLRIPTHISASIVAGTGAAFLDPFSPIQLHPP